MNSKQLVNYVKAHTGRELHLPQLILYIEKGWLTVDRSGTRNDYSIKMADRFVRYLLSLDLTQAAKEMSERLGENITVGRIRSLCEQNMIIYIGSPYRIPEDTLHIVQEQLIAQRGIPAHVAENIISECLYPATLTDLANHCSISLSMMSYIADGKRTMTPAVYDKLLELANGEDNE